MLSLKSFLFNKFKKKKPVGKGQRTLLGITRKKENKCHINIFNLVINKKMQIKQFQFIPGILAKVSIHC